MIKYFIQPNIQPLAEPLTKPLIKANKQAFKKPDSQEITKQETQTSTQLNLHEKQKIYSSIISLQNIKLISLKFTFFILFFANINLHGQLADCAACNSANNISSCASCDTAETCCIGKCDGSPYLQFRSQGRNLARQHAGLENFINKVDMPLTYGAFSSTLEYSQSFNSKKLSHFLFGSDLVNCCELYVQGSQVENRNSKAWLADYFGLPEDFQSKVKFCPSIKNVVLDLNFYIGLDELTPGLFMQIDAPLTWTKWELNQCEQVISTATIGYPAGYMAQSSTNRASLGNSFLQIMGGGYDFADEKIPMRYGRITSCDNEAIGFAEIDFTLGYNFILNQDSHVGALIYASAPTGTRPCATKLFEPIIGNGKHWELGAGLTSSYIFYASEQNDNRYVGLWFDAIIGHLFKTRQIRSFDFCGKPNSRYMLLEEMTTADGKLTGQDPYAQADKQYAGNLIPVINWSTFNIKTQIDVQADMAIKLSGARDNINFDLGYNFWARSGEEFSSFSTCPCDTSKKYAIKGDALLYGQWSDGVSTATIIPMSQTQSCATIHGPKVNCETQRSIIDNPELAFYTDNSLHRQVTEIDGSTQIETSITPTITSRSLLNTGKSPSAITHKIFGNIGYAWNKDGQKKAKETTSEQNIPFICFGGEIEFSQDKYKDCCCSCNNSGCNTSGCNTSGCSASSNNNCTNASSCGTSNCGCGQTIVTNGNKVTLKECEAPRIALCQWGLWIKGGVSFN